MIEALANISGFALGTLIVLAATRVGIWLGEREWRWWRR